MAQDGAGVVASPDPPQHIFGLGVRSGAQRVDELLVGRLFILQLAELALQRLRVCLSRLGVVLALGPSVAAHGALGSLPIALSDVTRSVFCTPGKDGRDRNKKEDRTLDLRFRHAPQAAVV